MPRSPVRGSARFCLPLSPPWRSFWRRSGEILGLFVREGLRLALFGVSAGLIAAFAPTRFLSSLLYGVEPTDPSTFLFTSMLLSAIALLACYIPERRATKVDPLLALRSE